MQVTLSIDWTSGILILLGSGVATGLISELFKWSIARLGAPVDAYSQERAKIRAQLSEIEHRIDDQRRLTEAIEGAKIKAQLDKLEERISEQVRLTEEVEAVRLRLVEESQERQRRATSKLDIYSRILQCLARIMSAMSLALNEWDNRKLRAFIDPPSEQEEQYYEDYNEGIRDLSDALSTASIVIGQEFYESVKADMEKVLGVSSDQPNADSIVAEDLRTLKALMKRIRETAAADMGFAAALPPQV